jgi:hypothetical protein
LKFVFLSSKTFLIQDPKISRPSLAQHFYKKLMEIIYTRFLYLVQANIFRCGVPVILSEAQRPSSHFLRLDFPAPLKAPEEHRFFTINHESS